MFGHVPFSYSYDSEWLCIVEQPLAWPGDGGGPKGRGTQRGMGEVKKKEEKWTILHMSIKQDPWWSKNSKSGASIHHVLDGTP